MILEGSKPNIDNADMSNVKKGLSLLTIKSRFLMKAIAQKS